jgi:4-aminobutyrate aminotransferase-like enzyme
MDVDSQSMLGLDEQRIPARDPEPVDALDSLGIVMEAAARAEETFELAARHLDTSLVDVLRILGFDRDYVSARGSYVYDGAGRAYLDFHTGEGFASLGHNNPDVAEVLHAVLGRPG